MAPGSVAADALVDVGSACSHGTSAQNNDKRAPLGSKLAIPYAVQRASKKRDSGHERRENGGGQRRHGIDSWNHNRGCRRVGGRETTLLKALAGLEGDDVECGPKACVYIQQQPVVFTNSVASELMLSHRLFPDILPSGKAYSDLFQLNELEQQRVDDLSSGERQRLVLARQFSLMPSLLLLDECTSNLGWLHVQIIEQELLRLKEGGACIVMVTHNIPQAHRLADTLVVMREGRTLSLDDPFAASLLKGEYIDQS